MMVRHKETPDIIKEDATSFEDIDEMTIVKFDPFSSNSLDKTLNKGFSINSGNSF
jgi:hypothetical protein